MKKTKTKEAPPARVRAVEFRIRLPPDLASDVQQVCAARGLEVNDLLRIAARSMMNRAPREFDLSDIMTFGKYQGELIETIVRADPSYIHWLLERSNNFMVTPAVGDLLRSVETTHQVSRGYGP